MYICICKGVTDDQIMNLIKMGLPRSEVLRRLGVGDDCGVCILSSVDSLIASHQENKQSK